MTLEEIRSLDLGATSGGRFTQVRVPSLNELLNAVKARCILNEVVFMSLDYDIITYIEDAHPKATSGYTYFLGVGKSERLVGDYLILEEDAASRNLIDRIHSVGKKAAIWTVNTEDSMNNVSRDEAVAARPR